MEETVPAGKFNMGFWSSQIVPIEKQYPTAVDCVDLVNRALPPQDYLKLISVGAGNGAQFLSLPIYAANHREGEVSATMVDIQRDAGNAALNLIEEVDGIPANLRLEVINADGATLPLSSCSQHLIFQHELLQWAEDPSVYSCFLNEAQRVLMPGGILHGVICSIFNPAAIIALGKNPENELSIIFNHILTMSMRAVMKEEPSNCLYTVMSPTYNRNMFFCALEEFLDSQLNHAGFIKTIIFPYSNPSLEATFGGPTHYFYMALKPLRTSTLSSYDIVKQFLRFPSHLRRGSSLYWVV